jgi:hypothetical protein
VGGKPAFSSNYFVAEQGNTITLLNSTGVSLKVISESGSIGYAGWWPNAVSNVFTVVSSSGGYIQLDGLDSPCSGLSELLKFRAPGAPVCAGADCKTGGSVPGASRGVGISGSLEGLVLRSEHFSELAMKDDVALLAATTKEAQIAAAEKAIIHEKAALRASEKVLQALTHPTQPSR